MNLKNLVLLALVAFLVFWLVQDPRGMADSSESLFAGVWRLVSGLFEAVLDFVAAL